MKRKLFIALSIIASNSIAQMPTSGLVAYYPFNGNANDATANGNNGAVNGATLTADRFGNANSAYNFNGSSDFIQAASINNIPLGNTSRTISAWVKTNGTFYGRSIVMYGLSSSNPYHFFMACQGTNNGYLWASEFLGAATNSQIMNTNLWVHVVVTYASPDEKLYINGVLVASTTSTAINTPNGSLIIGRQLDNNPSDSYCWLGQLDDIAIWNRALTTTEVQQLYNGCVGAPTASITAHGNTTFCTGDNVYLVASPGTGGTYQWQKNNVNIGGAKSKTYTAKTSGTYRCIVTNPCGNSSSNAITITALPIAAVTISAATPTTFCAGGNVTFTGTNPGVGYVYQWYKGSVSINGATGLSYVAESPGSYKMVNTNTANGCSRITNSKSVVVNCRMANPGVLIGSGVNDDDIDNSIHLYPNPSKGSFTLELGNVEEGSANIELLNALGQVIYNENVEVENELFQKQIELKDATYGLHILRISTNNKLYERKVLIN